MHLTRRRKDARKGKRRIEDVSRRNVLKLTQIVTSQTVKQAFRSLLRLLRGARWDKRKGFKASTLEDSAMEQPSGATNGEQGAYSDGSCCHLTDGFADS